MIHYHEVATWKCQLLENVLSLLSHFASVSWLEQQGTTKTHPTLWQTYETDETDDGLFHSMVRLRAFSLITRMLIFISHSICSWSHEDIVTWSGLLSRVLNLNQINFIICWTNDLLLIWSLFITVDQKEWYINNLLIT